MYDEDKMSAGVMNANYTKIEILPVECRRLWLKRPISVYFAEDKGEYFVFWPKIDEFGVGSNLQDALDDVFHTVADFFTFLITNEHRLSPGLRETLIQFREVIHDDVI